MVGCIGLESSVQRGSQPLGEALGEVLQTLRDASRHQALFRQTTSLVGWVVAIVTM